MKVKVVGCELREGDFQGNHYKNYLLYVVDKNAQNVLFGVAPKTIKIRAKFIDDNQINLKEFFQHDIEVFYDAYGNVARIDG